MSTVDTSTQGLTWFVIRARPGREASAVEGLKERGFTDVYLPTERRLVRGLRGSRPVDRALIPGLIFLGIGPSSPSVYEACRVSCVTDLVRQASGEAAAIRRCADGHHPVYDIRAREAAGEFDHTPKAKKLRRGERVRIAAGPFSGWVGEVLKAEPGERARVVLSGLFGGKSGVPVDPKHLEPVAA